MRVIMILAALLLLNPVRAELVNLNPNPFGEPWYAGGWRELTASDLAKIDALPKLDLPAASKGKLLPTHKDNSQEIYFRPVFNQEGGSCGQASGVAYNFTYEMALARQTAANTAASQYPSHHTWNFLNGGTGQGSTYFDGWEIIKANGIPDVATYGDLWPADYYDRSSIWLDGYAKYYQGMKNRVTEVASINVGTPEGLQTLKQWMNDHLSGMSVGGLANFSAGVSSGDGYSDSYLPSGTPYSGKSVITRWGSSVNHAMTFVGYDDSIRYDVNNDGRYTNNIDINGDGIVNMRDWEKGGLIMVNSWGEYWGDNGRMYVLYHLLAESVEDGGIQGNSVYVVKVRPDYQPKLTVKAKIRHNFRSKIKIYAGASADVNATAPAYYLSYPLFNHQGGEYSLTGVSGNDNPLEIGLDITPLLSELSSGQYGKIFLLVKEQDAQSQSSGEVISFSVLNYTGTQPVETVCPQTNTPLTNNGITMLNVMTGATYDAVAVTTDHLPYAGGGMPYSYQLMAAGGQVPYKWNLKYDPSQAVFTENFPAITDNPIAFASGDDSYKTIDLGFEFPFFGKKYSQITVLTDGVLVFSAGFNYIRTEGALSQNRAIAVFGADLMINEDENDGVFVKKENGKITFRWKISQWEHPEINIDAAAVLTDDGQVKMYYNNSLSTGVDWVSGLSDGDGVNFYLSEISNLPDASNQRRKFVQKEFPAGLNLSADGLLHGTPFIPYVNRTYNLKFVVTDFNRISKTKVLDLTGGEVGIADPDNSKQADLLSAYPNPFNNSARINFSLNSECTVKLTVFDISGREVKTLHRGNLPGGLHGVKFDAAGLSSGVYFVRLQTPGHNLTKQLLLLK